MQPTTDYSLLRISQGPRSHLLRRGADTGLVVDGVWLEGQFAVPEGQLLMVVDDALLEDALQIYLVDAGPRVLDCIELRRMYAGGTLTGLRPCGERSLEFSFLADDRWRLDVSPRPRWQLHLPFPHRDVHRDGVLAKRWLRLSRTASQASRPGGRPGVEPPAPPPASSS